MDKNRKRKILQTVNDIIKPIIEELEYKLWDVDYLVERGRWILRVYIDKTDGISIDDCVTVSKEISPILDIKDPINNPYVLEVSSPGLDRPLRKESHFIWAIGKKVKIRTYLSIEGRRNFTGLLENFKDGILYLNIEGNIFTLNYDEIEKAKVVYEIDKSIL